MSKDATPAFWRSRFPGLSRRYALAFTAGIPAAAGIAFAADTAPDPPPPGSDFPRQQADTVREVVGASHFNFARVKELVSARPALALASWDWGFGDWETALGAASHVGRVDIALFLMEHGARPDLFTHAMLGHLGVIRAAVEASPGIQRIKGPHGIPLLQHALNTIRSKDAPSEVVTRAKATAAYLESLGDAGAGNLSLETTSEQAERYLGSYRFGKAATQVLHVRKNREGRLTLSVEGQGALRLHRVDEHGFAPPGASQVRIRFTMDESTGLAHRVTIHDPVPVAVATRI
jgi:hypothetical protein